MVGKISYENGAFWNLLGLFALFHFLRFKQKDQI